MMKRLILSLCVLAVLTPESGMAQIRGIDILGPYGAVYDIVWDGWKGELVLRPEPWRGDSVLIKDGARYAVRYQVLLDPQQKADRRWAPGYCNGSLTPGCYSRPFVRPSNLKHRIVFWVDFSNTPQNLEDDQRFDGYFMKAKTAEKNAIAGVTWWDRIPFGFYAVFKYDVPG